MQTISRTEVRERIRSEDNLAVVEVLPEASYRECHLPQAINVPLGQEFDRRIQQAVPEKDRPVIVYCHDADCDASPKAAQRMDVLGYEQVYDYEAGKVDWQAAGLPLESGA